MSDGVHELPRRATFAEFNEKCLTPNCVAVFRRADDDGLPRLWFAENLRELLSPQCLLSFLDAAQPVPVVRQLAVGWTTRDCAATYEATPLIEEGGCGNVPLGRFLEENGVLFIDASTRCDAFVSVKAHTETVYLKDWHFWQAMRLVGPHPLYILPDFLATDTFNPYCDECSTNITFQPFGNRGSDYRFIYAGHAGSWTPCHADVCGTYSWSLNLSGVKLWYFLDYIALAERHAEQDLIDRLPSSDALIGTPVEIRDRASRRLIRSGHLPVDLRCSTLPTVTVMQYPGDLVFVPSLHVHQVHNLTPALSVNHNWAHATNAERMVWLLLHEASVAAAAVDSDAVEALAAGGEWRTTLDLMLRGSGGWSVAAMKGFLDFSLNNAATDSIAASLLRAAIRQLDMGIASLPFPNS